MAEQRSSGARSPLPLQPTRTGREIIGRRLQRTLLSLTLAGAFAYAVDYLLLQYRVATNHSPFGSVTVQPYYAVPQKDHKTEFLFDDPQNQTCVHSLFPHMGNSPCWYLSRHQEKRINM